MTSEKMESSDTSGGQRLGSDIKASSYPGRGSGGCYVSTLVGLLLVILTVLLTIAVGIIVYFAADGRGVVCECGTVGRPRIDENDFLHAAKNGSLLTKTCMFLVKQGHSEICNASTPSSTSSPVLISSSTSSTTSSTSSTTKSISIPSWWTTQKPKPLGFRLPKTVKPIHYNIQLQPYMNYTDPQLFHFKGSVLLIVECVSATDTIILHYKILQIDDASIQFKSVDSDVTVPAIVALERNPGNQFLIIKLSENLQPGRRYTIEMTFTSPLRDNLKGFYYSSYKRGNKTVYLATTQMSAIDARSVFPCMDEPALKATFNLTLVRPKHLMSMSNSPIMETSDSWYESGIEYVSDVYQQTPLMSTYLLAFVICDFEYTQGTSSNGIEFRHFARPDVVNATSYSLELGMKIQSYFEKYFDIRYPLAKQDMIAIPDFSFGAMENWGLITFRETLFLYSPLSTSMEKEAIATVVSHELAHNWFGNLVTMSWWNDAWLNEGFSTFVSYLGLDHAHPEWKMHDKFVISEMHKVFTLDSFITSNPICHPVDSNKAIMSAFGVIAYKKAGSVIRMMRHFLGFETFRKGITKYLKSHAYSNVNGNDLWTALGQQAHEDGLDIDLKAIMDTWTLQMNYPIVTVSRDISDLDAIHVTQERCLRDKTAKQKEYQDTKSPYGYQWTIPITLTSSKSLKVDQTDKDVLWMYSNETRKTFNIGSENLPSAGDSNGWILANVNVNGLYRVNYEFWNWMALRRQLIRDHKVIPVANRAQIINDAFHLARNGDLDQETALAMLEYLSNEMDYIPWHTAIKELRYMRNMMVMSTSYGAFQRFLRKMSQRAYEKLGLDDTGSSHDETLLRDVMVDLACSSGNKHCLQHTASLFRKWMDNPPNDLIISSLRTHVYVNAIRQGGWDEWNFAFQVYLNTSNSVEKSRLLFAMGSTLKPWIMNKYLGMINEENSPIRKQDALAVVKYVATNPIGRSLAWHYLRDNFNDIGENQGFFSSSLGSVVRMVTYCFNTEVELQEILNLKSNLNDKEISKIRPYIIDQAIEYTKGNIKWMSKNEPIIAKWLKDRGY